MSHNRQPIQMTGSHLLIHMLRFAYPLMISNAFQRFFNAADSMIVGRYAGELSLAAVGATAPVVSMFTWGLMGLSIGADVTVSRLIGKGDYDEVQKAIHTAYFIACFAGILTASFGFLFAGVILTAMGTPASILSLSVLYIRIYFMGLFFILVYNFGAAILRSNGDTRRPTLFIMTAGLINVLLNLVFVCLFRMNVAGVALATVISQCFAATAVTRTLIREDGYLHLDLRKIRPDRPYILSIISIGLPSLIQNMLFSFSNIIVQSSINAFGDLVIAGNSAATTLEEFVYVSTSAVNQTNITFTGQNYGAGKIRNIRKVLLNALTLTSLFGFAIGSVDHFMGTLLLLLFLKDPAALEAGLIRVAIVAQWLFLNGVSDLFAGSLRAMGHATLPTVITLAGICGFRLFHILILLPKYHTLSFLYLCYPLSWIFAIIPLLILWVIIYRRKLHPKTPF